MKLAKSSGYVKIASRSLFPVPGKDRMPKNKLNCWEIKKCGRERGGRDEQTMGVCPASVEVRLDTIHSGKNAGRACWVIAGTMCDGTVQGSFAKKLASCEVCSFYKQVKQEEGSGFFSATVLLKKLKFG